MQERNKDKQVVIAVIIGFVVCFMTQMLVATVLYPDMSGDYPVYSVETVMVAQFGGVCMLISLSILGMRAEEEKEILAAAGFTAMAIGMGVGLAGFLEVMGVSDAESYQSFYYISICANFVFIPAMFLIATYPRFKKWIRAFGVLAIVPMVMVTIMFLVGVRDYVLLENIYNLGYLMLSFTTLFWTGNLWVNYRRGVKGVIY